MAVIRVEKTKDFTVMSNYHFKDNRLSLKAKGLMSEMLSLPDEWDYSIAGLVSINLENESSIKSALKELRNAGYLEVIKKLPNQTESGRLEYEYILHEMPKQAIEKQGVENLPVEILPIENQGQLNTNISNTKETNTKETYIEKESKPKKEPARFIPPSLEDVSVYCRERGNNVDPQRFIDHYTSNGWMVGKTKMKDWRASVRTWERNESQKPAPKAQKAFVNPFEQLERELGYDTEGNDPALEAIIGKLPECYQ